MNVGDGWGLKHSNLMLAFQWSNVPFGFDSIRNMESWLGVKF